MLKSTQYNIESLTVFLQKRMITAFVHWSFSGLAISPCHGVLWPESFTLQEHLHVEALKVNMVLNMKVFIDFTPHDGGSETDYCCRNNAHIITDWKLLLSLVNHLSDYLTAEEEQE